MQIKLKSLSLKRLIVTIVIVGLAILFVVPFIWMLLSSFKNLGDIYKIPIEWLSDNMSLANYKKVLGLNNPSFMTYFWNSVKVSLFSVTIQIITSAMAGYAFAKFDFKGKNFLFVMILATMMIPFQAIMVPQFLLFKSLGIYNTHLALILPKLTTPLGIFMMRQYFSSIPNEIIESARIDGASELKIFWKIMLPLAKPMLATLSVLTFIWKWNEYEQPLIFLNNRELFTLPLGLLNFVNEAGISQDNLVLAASVLSLLPIFVVYGLCQKHIISGLTNGSVKG